MPIAAFRSLVEAPADTSTASVVGFAASTTTGATISVTKAAVEAAAGGTVSNGDVVVAVLSVDWGILPAAQSGWTGILSAQGGADSYGVSVQAKVAASEPATWTFPSTTGNNPDATLQIIVLRNVTLAGVVAAVSAEQPMQSASPIVAPTVDHAGTAGSIHLAGASAEENNAGANTWTPPGGMTEVSDIQSQNSWTSSSLAYQINPTDPTGTKSFLGSRTWTAGKGRGWAAVFPPTTAVAVVEDTTKFFLAA